MGENQLILLFYNVELGSYNASLCDILFAAYVPCYVEVSYENNAGKQQILLLLL
jgi:hypothetical protein